MPERPSPSSAGGRTPAPLPADAIAALARQVERLETKIDAFHLDNLQQGLHGLATTVAGLAEELAELAHQSDEREKPAPSWLAPSEPLAQEEATAVLAQVIRWARRVYVGYADAALPECWLWHPQVIEELIWLRSAWISAYRGPMASAQRAGDWHDRQRPGVVRRIRTAAGSCSLREHFEQPPPSIVPAEDASPAIAAWWVTPSAAMPTPTSEQLRAADAAHRRIGGWQ
jgi:hypothetical protein